MKVTPPTPFEPLYQHFRKLSGYPDGTLYVEQENDQVIAITKRDGQLLLSILPAHDPRSYFVQTAVDLTNPDHLPYAYMQAMLVGLVWTTTPQRIGLLGLGGGAIPLVLHHYYPQAILEIAEISPAVVRLAQRFFGVTPDENLHLHVMDARDFLDKQTSGFDLLIIDAFGDKGFLPYHLATYEFYLLCRHCLTDKGVAVFNFPTDSRFFTHRVITVQAAFDSMCYLPASEQNTIFFGSKDGAPGVSTFVARARNLDHEIEWPFSISTWADKMELAVSPLQGDHTGNAEYIFYDGDPPSNYREDINEHSSF